MAVPAFPLGQLLAMAPNLSQLKVRLFTNTPATGLGSLALADLVEPSTPGYAPSGPDDWLDAECPDEDVVSRKSKPIDFRATGAAPGTTVKGVFVTAHNGTAQVLLSVDPFENARPFAAVNDNVVCSVDLVVFNQAGFPAP